MGLIEAEAEQRPVWDDVLACDKVLNRPFTSNQSL